MLTADMVDKAQQYLDSTIDVGAKGRARRERHKGLVEPQSILNTRVAARVLAAAKEQAEREGRLLYKFVELAIEERVERLKRSAK